MWKNCTPLWREAHFEVKMLKNWGVRSTFWSWDVQKLHVVARSTFWSQNRKKLTVSDNFLKFRCRKIARRCGEQHICKSKCTKYLCFAVLFDQILAILDIVACFPTFGGAPRAAPSRLCCRTYPCPDNRTYWPVQCWRLWRRQNHDGSGCHCGCLDPTLSIMICTKENAAAQAVAEHCQYALM